MGVDDNNAGDRGRSVGLFVFVSLAGIISRGELRGEVARGCELGIWSERGRLGLSGLFSVRTLMVSAAAGTS